MSGYDRFNTIGNGHWTTMGNIDHKTGNINVTQEEARRTQYVATMGAVFRWKSGREASRR